VAWLLRLVWLHDVAETVRGESAVEIIDGELDRHRAAWLAALHGLDIDAAAEAWDRLDWWLTRRAELAAGTVTTAASEWAAPKVVPAPGVSRGGG
jgi:hypothetical protein